MELEPEPLPRKLVEKAKAEGVVKINVCWSGGGDEGSCNVNLEADMTAGAPSGIRPRASMSKEWQQLEQEFEEWAETAFDYSGAGDGNAYGDDLVYDLEKNTVQCSHWSQRGTFSRDDGEEVELELQTEGENDGN